MADAQQTLCRHPAVGDDADHGRHEQRYDALHGIENADVRRQTDRHQIRTHGGKVGTPHGVLQEVHDSQTQFNSHSM